MAKKKTSLSKATAPPLSAEELVRMSLEEENQEPDTDIQQESDTQEESPVQKAKAQDSPTPPETVAQEPQPERVVQMNIRVPESLRTRLKIRCLETGKDMQDVIADLIRDYLE